MATTTAPPPSPPRRPVLSSFLRWDNPTAGALGALILLSIFNAFSTTNFLTLATLRVNLTQVSTIVLVAVGMTLVIATGGVDLSVGSLMAIAGSLAPLIFLSEQGWLGPRWVAIPVAIVVPILVAGMFGLMNGMLVTRFQVQPIVATLVLFLGGRGIAKLLLDGKLKEFDMPAFEYIGKGRPLGVPVSVFLMIVVVAIAAWGMRATSFGRYVLATGGNEEAARLAGVPVSRTRLAVYGITGMLAGLAGLIEISRTASSNPSLVGVNMELNAIAAAAVGGTVLTGGRATILGTLIGAILVQQIRYTLISNGVADGTTRIVTAAAILVAVLLQRRGGS